MGGIKLLTGNSHPELANVVAERLGIPLLKCQVSRFADGETSVSISQSVRESDVFILQTGFNPRPSPLPSPPSPSNAPPPPTPPPIPPMDPNDLIMELLILISACKTASANRITAVIPCFPYSRMDRKDRSRAPITAKLVANMLQIAGADHVITFDLHASQIQGFFEVPVDNLWTEPIMCRYVKMKVEGWREKAVIVSPDAGGAKRATAIADRLGIDFALINRKRQKASSRKDGEEDEQSLERMELLVGDVKGKTAILIDDMCDTGETLALAATTLKGAGAEIIYAIVSHGLLSNGAIDIIRDLECLQKLVVTNTIDQQQNTELAGGKLETMDVSQVIAEAIRRTHNGESISLLYSDVNDSY